MSSPSIQCDLLIPRFGCGWWHEKAKKRVSCTLLLRDRICPILKHRLEEEWAHVPGRIKEAVLSGTYPAVKLLRWERIVDDLLDFVLVTVDAQYGPYHSHHEALGLIREEYREYEDLVFAMEDSSPKAITGPTKDEECSAILELRDVATVALMAQYHLTRHMEEVNP